MSNLTDLALTSQQALWFLIPSIPICLYVIFTDLRSFRIPNTMVLALFGAFVVIGPFVMALDDYAWRFLHMIVVLFIGYLLTMFVGVGAGDSKFAAAMAPFVALPDVTYVLMLYAICSIAGLVLHRIIRKIPAFQTRLEAGGWESFDTKRGHFPLGISLAAMHLIYLVTPLV